MNNRKIKRTPLGQWKYPHEPTIVPTPTGKITMQGLDYPVLGIDNLGNSEMMIPGQNYQFPGNEVLELPVNKFEKGGSFNQRKKRVKFDTGGDLIDDKNSTRPQLHYYRSKKDNSLKGLNTNQLANLRSSDFESEEDYVSYLNSGASYNCGKDNCALYAHDRAGELIGLTGRDYVRWVGDGKYSIGVSGNAWQNLGNIEEFGGQTIYRKDKNQELDSSQVRIGDIVGLGSGRVTRNSRRYNTSGINAPKAGATNSHTGIVEYIDKDGNIYVRHNIKGNTSVQKIVPSSKGHTLEGSSTWDIFSVARPNYESYKPAPISIDPETNSPRVAPFESDYNPDSFVKFFNPDYATLPKVDEQGRPIRDSYQPDSTFPRTTKDLLEVPNLENTALNDVLNTPVQFPISEKSGNPAMQEFYNSLYDNKEKLMQYFRMTDADFNEYAALALATVAAETEFGTNKRQKYKEAVPPFTRLVKSLKDRTNYSQDEMSVGLGQVKPYSTSNFFKREFGITNKSMRTPAHNALAVFEHLVTDSENAKRWAEDNNQEYPQEINEDYKKLGAVAYVNPRLIRAGNLTFNEQFNKPNEINNTDQFNLNSSDNARLRYINHILPQIQHYDENTMFRGNRLNEFTVTPNDNEESIETNKKYGGKIKYQEGGEFENFVNTLPDNLRYSGPDYNLRGMWEASGSPKSFSDVKDTEYFPLQDDGVYHGFSVGNEGNFLKSSQHPTAWMEYLYGYQLNPENNKNFNVVPNIEGHFGENQLQYVPMRKYGGKIKYQSGGNFNMRQGSGESDYTFWDGLGSFAYGTLQGTIGAIPGVGAALTPALEAGRKGLQSLAGNTDKAEDDIIAGIGGITGAVGTSIATGNPMGALGGSEQGINKITSTFDKAQDFDKLPLFKKGGNMKRGRTKFYQMGGDMGLTEYEGLSHDEGGLPIPGRNAEVEGGETMIDDYVFSDSLQVPGKKKTFAQESKAIKNKYNLRKGDPLSQEVVNESLQELMALQEGLKKEMASEKMNEALELDPTILDSMMQGDPSMQQGMPQEMSQEMPMGPEGMMPMEGMPMMQDGGKLSTSYENELKRSKRWEHSNKVYAHYTRHKKPQGTAKTGAVQARKINYQDGGKLNKYQRGGVLDSLGEENLNTILNNVEPGMYSGQDVTSQNNMLLGNSDGGPRIPIEPVSQDTLDLLKPRISNKEMFQNNVSGIPNISEFLDDEMPYIDATASNRGVSNLSNRPNYGKVRNVNIPPYDSPQDNSDITLSEFEQSKLPMRLAQGLNAVGPIANFIAAGAGRQPRLTRNQNFTPISSRPAEMLLESSNNRALATGRDSLRNAAPNQQSFLANTTATTSKVSEDIGKEISDLRFRNDISNIQNRQNIDATNIANQTANNLLLDNSDANRWNLALHGVQGLQEGMQQGLMDEMMMDSDLLKIALSSTPNYRYNIDNKGGKRRITSTYRNLNKKPTSTTKTKQG
jgi:hypothetical protein